MPSKQHCFCRNGSSGFMIYCEGCKIWFHGQCVQVTEKASKAFSEWYCPWCTRCQQSAKQEHQKFHVDIEKMKDELKSMKTIVENLQGKLHRTEATKQSELITCKERCSTLEAELDKVNQSFQNFKEEKLCIENEEKLHFETERDGLKRALASKQDELNNLQQSLENFKEEKLRIENEEKLRFETERDDLKRALASKQAELNNLHLSFENFKDKKSPTVNEEEMFRVECECGTLKRALASKQGELHNLQQNFEDLKEEKLLVEGNLKSEVERISAEICSVKAENRELKATLSTIKRRKLSLSQR